MVFRGVDVLCQVTCYSSFGYSAFFYSIYSTVYLEEQKSSPGYYQIRELVEDVNIEQIKSYSGIRKEISEPKRTSKD